MKSTGIVRKIDELGRIVIPKEIRKTLSIKDNEDLEIFTYEDTIILKKYNKILNMKEKTMNLIDIFKKYLNGNIILTDREKILYSELDELNDKKLSNKFMSILEERKKITNLENVSLELNKDNIVNTKYLFSPIIIDADLLGSVMLLTAEKLGENEMLIFSILCTLIKYELEN